MKAFIINRDADTIRKEAIIKQSQNIADIEIEFFSAIIGSSLDKEKLLNLSTKISQSHSDINWRILNGEIGCYLSHLNVYDRIANDNKSEKDWYLILEDDVILSQHFIDLMNSKKIKRVLTKTVFGIIVLGFDSGIELNYKNPSRRYCHSIEKINNYYNIGIPRYNHYGSFAYFITKADAQKLYTLGLQFPTLSDYLLYQSPLAGIKLGILNKPLIFPNFKFDSNIRDQHSFLTKEFVSDKIDKISLKQKISELIFKPQYEYLK
jgi:glycosyl transferase family 25